MLKCKSATLTIDGGINTVWEDSKDETSKWELVIEPETAEALIDYAKWEKEIKKTKINQLNLDKP